MPKPERKAFEDLLKKIPDAFHPLKKAPPNNHKFFQKWLERQPEYNFLKGFLQ